MMPAQTTATGYGLKQLLHGLTDVEITPGVVVTGVTDDSRTLHSGDLFIARSGQHSNGSQFIAQALAAGAAAVVVDAGQDLKINGAGVPVIPVPGLAMKTGIIAARFYGDPSASLAVVGVTGTNGKSTVSYALARVLDSIRADSCGLIGTLGFGQSGNLTASLNTTPGAISLQQILRGMKDQSVHTVVMEVSSHGLDQGRVAGIHFHTGVFTNLTEEHLDYHGDMEAYAEAKKQLFLSPGLAHAVINTDDPYGQRLSRELGTSLRVVEYGLNRGARDTHAQHEYISAVILENRLDLLHLDIESSWGGGQVEIRAGGEFNAYNSLAVLAVLHLLGIDFEQSLAALPGVFPIPGRIETFRGSGDIPVVVDYAHTPDALENILRSLRAVCSGQLICVFGCGGDRHRGKRPRMGAIACRYADRIFLTNDNPRSEQPEAIIDDILAGMENRNAVTVQTDRAQAIAAAIACAGHGDIVLVAGKGHETYQETGGRRYPFSDRQLVRSLLGGEA